MMHSLYAVADMGNGQELIKLYVEELNDVNSDGTIKRAYQLQNITKVPATSVRVQNEVPSSLTNIAGTEYTVSQLFNIVKSFDKNFSPKSSSKVTNGDGTPKVVYHGTNEIFTVFDSKTKMYWFSESRDYAEAMAEERGGDEVMPVYLDIKNPFYITRENKTSYRKTIERELEKGGYDGIIDTTNGTCVVFSPEQIKSATENIGTFDGENPDIEYKIRDVQADTEEKAKKTAREPRTEYDTTSFSSYADYLAQRIDALDAENEKLRKGRGILEKMAAAIGDVHVDALDVAEYAGEVKEQTGTHMTKREIASRIEDIYTRIAHSGADDDGSAAYTELFALANDILENSDKVDRTMYNRYAGLRDMLRNTPITISREDRADIADYGEFVKRNRGRLRITKDGTSVDAFYEQLAEEYPEFFAETGKTHPADRLLHIAQVRDGLDPVYDNRAHTEEEAAMLAQDMFANYFNDKNASWEHQTLIEMVRSDLRKRVKEESEAKYRDEIEHYKERAEYYRDINSRVAERVSEAQEEDDTAPDWVDTDVTGEYGEKYTSKVRFAPGDKSAVRVLRRKRPGGGDTLVIDYDRPGVAEGGKYRLSAGEVYTEIIDRVKKRKKADEGLFEGKSHGREGQYYLHDVWHNFRDFFGERDFGKMKSLILDPLDDSKKHYQYIQEFYTNIVYEKIVKDLGIKKGSKLSEMVQKYGEKTITEEELHKLSEKDLEKIRTADRIFRGIYDGLIDTINETRRKIYPYAEKQAQKTEQALREIREERAVVESAYYTGDLSELSEKKWADLKKIEIRRESTQELIYRTRERAKARRAELDAEIAAVEEKMSQKKNKTTKGYYELEARLDGLETKRAAFDRIAEAEEDKLRATCERLNSQFTSGSTEYKSRLAERIAVLAQREEALKQTMLTDAISYGREIRKRQDYYRHFEEIKGAVPVFMNYMKKSIADGVTVRDAVKGFVNSSGFRQNANIDNRLAGKSADTKPKTRWASIFQARNDRAEITYDAVGGFLDYIPAAAYAAAIDPNISMFRALAEDLAKAEPGVGNNTDLGSFAGYLQKYANELAGKTNEIFDRSVGDILGRNTMRRLNAFSSRIKSNMVCYNISSSLAQILNVPQAVGYMANHPAALTAAVGDTLAAMVGKGKAAQRYKYSSFLTERFADDYSRFERGPKKAAQDAANFLLGAMDEVGTKYIWNAAYRSGVAEGAADPVRHADDVTRRMVSGRGIGEMPYYQKAKIVGMFIPFTLEAGNVLDVYSDLIRDGAKKVHGKKGAAKIAAVGGAAAGDAMKFLILFMANHFFNRVLEMIRGTDGGLFDPISDVQNAIENEYDVWQTVGAIAGDFAGTVPAGGMIAGIYPENGINLWAFSTPTREQIFAGSDPTRFGSGNVFSSMLENPIENIVFPSGGSQINKAAKAAYSIAGGAVKTKSGNVKYEVEDNVKNRVKGVLFGNSGLGETREYYDKQEVHFSKVPEGFEYKKKSRTIKINDEEVKLEEKELKSFEKVRMARYEQLAQKENREFSLRNPYIIARNEISDERNLPEKAKKKNEEMVKLLGALVEQGDLTPERRREIQRAYTSGTGITVRGVEFYAPTKIDRVKKFSEIERKQQAEYMKELKAKAKRGEIDVWKWKEIAQKVQNKDYDFEVTIREYITGDFESLTPEEQKAVRSKMNSEATSFAKEKIKKEMRKNGKH